MPYAECPDCSGDIFIGSNDTSIKCRHCGAEHPCRDGEFFLDEKKIAELNEENKARINAAKETGDFTDLSTAEIASISSEIILTTAFSVSNRVIVSELEIISAECVYGMHIFKDFFAGVRDIFGGRSKAMQNTLRDARRTAIAELRREALMVGGDAVIGVSLDYHEVSSGGKNGMIMLVASGTAVKLK